MMRDGEPWFVAADVCRVLEIQNPTDTVRRLDEDEVTLDQIEGNHRPMNLVSEPGLYRLIGRSDKPVARRFMRWLCHEVLPSMRTSATVSSVMIPSAARRHQRSRWHLTVRVNPGLLSIGCPGNDRLTDRPG